MLTKLTRSLSNKNLFFSPIFGALILSLFLSLSTKIYAQEDLNDTFDESIVKNGESLFKGNCTVCHAIDEVIIGPALRDIHERRSEEWIYAFIKNSQKVIKSGDEYAIELYDQYNKTLMTSFDFSNEELNAILTYIKNESTKEVQVLVADAQQDNSCLLYTSDAADE